MWSLHPNEIREPGLENPNTPTRPQTPPKKQSLQLFQFEILSFMGNELHRLGYKSRTVNPSHVHCIPVIIKARAQKFRALRAQEQQHHLQTSRFPPICIHTMHPAWLRSLTRLASTANPSLPGPEKRSAPNAVHLSSPRSKHRSVQAFSAGQARTATIPPKRVPKVQDPAM